MRQDRPQVQSILSVESIISEPTTHLTLPDTTYSSNHDDAHSINTRQSVPTLHSVEDGLSSTLSELINSENALESNQCYDSDLTASETASQKDDDESELRLWLAHRKQFLILSAAGKPIYARYGSSQILSSYMGIIQAIMGFYQDSEDALQSYVCDELTIAIVVHGPVYLVAISKLNESVAALRVQLDLLYAHILSTVTATALKRVYDRSENFDLSRMIQGAEVFLDRLSDDMIRGDLSIMLSAVQVLRLRQTHRARIHAILQSSRQGAALLYGLVACNKQLVGILRPRGHSLFPADLRILFETVYSRGFEEGGEYWLPLCLPKFNASGFLYIYVFFITRSTSLILVSADKEAFFELQGIKQTVCKKLDKEGLIRELKKAAHKPVTCKEVGAGQIEHFFYKARQRVQFVAPSLPSSTTKPGNDAANVQSIKPLTRKGICQIYAILLAAMSYKIQILHLEDGLLGLCWQTQAFQICLIARSDRCDTGALVAAANAIHHFMRREEGRVLLSDGAVF
jgi:hypothetical protein